MYYCNVCRKTDPNVTHHVIPKDVSVRKRWLKAFGLKQHNITNHFRACGHHFDESCFQVDRYGKKLLMKGSIPSLLLSNHKILNRKSNLNNEVHLQMDSHEKPETKVAVQSNISTLPCVPKTRSQRKLLSASTSESVPLEHHSSNKRKSTLSYIDGFNLEPKQESSSEYETLQKSPQKKLKRWHNEIDVDEDISILTQAKGYFTMAINKVKILKQQITDLNETNERLVNIIEHLKDCLKHEKEKNKFIPGSAENDMGMSSKKACKYFKNPIKLEQIQVDEQITENTQEDEDSSDEMHEKMTDEFNNVKDEPEMMEEEYKTAMKSLEERISKIEKLEEQKKNVLILVKECGQFQDCDVKENTEEWLKPKIGTNKIKQVVVVKIRKKC